jgi:hypothetical protein
MLSRTLRMTIVHNDNQGVNQGPPHPSARLPRDCLTGQSVGGPPVHYPCCLARPSLQVGRIASDPATISATQFMGPHKSHMRQYCSMLAHQGPNDAVLSRHRQGLPPRSPEYFLIHSQPSHLVILHLQSLSCPAHVSN